MLFCKIKQLHYNYHGSRNKHYLERDPNILSALENQPHSCFLSLCHYYLVCFHLSHSCCHHLHQAVTESILQKYNLHDAIQAGLIYAIQVRPKFPNNITGCIIKSANLYIPQVFCHTFELILFFCYCCGITHLCSLHVFIIVHV